MENIERDSISPAWWNDQHTSAWERVKLAFKRDWEQTKADFSSKHGKELDQDVPDTVKQAVGSEPVPPVNVPNPPKPEKITYDDVEPAARFGFGAREQYADDKIWDENVESKLAEDWRASGAKQRWEDAKLHVRTGWDYANDRPVPGDDLH